MQSYRTRSVQSSKICRNGNKWTTNELLALQREYELLGLSIPEIAVRHNRTVQSIEFKIVSEKFDFTSDEV
jgi:hypothetical protein